nr:unnamed protein product [Spirometra erinaceieuropaei]
MVEFIAIPTIQTHIAPLKYPAPPTLSLHQRRHHRLSSYQALLPLNIHITHRPGRSHPSTGLHESSMPSTAKHRGPNPIVITQSVRNTYPSPTSPILFNYAIGWVFGRALLEGDGVEFAPGHRVTDLNYADDIALLASSFGDLQSIVSWVNEVARSVGLSINTGKTKVFSRRIPDHEKAPLGICGCQLEEVGSFKYLGAKLLPNGQTKDDIAPRIDAACWVSSSFQQSLWIRRDLSIVTKIRVYPAPVRSVLLYGCECYALRVEEEERNLEVFDHHSLRTILRVKFTDFVSNETVRARCDNIARITQATQEQRLRWFGHVLRRPPQELSVTALDPAPLPHCGGVKWGALAVETLSDLLRQNYDEGNGQPTTQDLMGH